MPVQTPVKPVQNRSTPLEISTLQKNLAVHQNEVSQKLATTLEAKISQTLPRIVSGVDQGIISRLAAEIAAESSQDVLENIAKITDFSQANTVIADSLTQSIVAHPELEGKLKTNEGKIFAGLLKQTTDIAQTHQQDLAKAAVLGSMVTIGRLEKPDEQLRSQVTGAVDQAVAARMPLAKPEVNQTLYGNASGFLQTYVANFQRRVGPQISAGKIPDFASYQGAKSAAFKDASAEFAKNVRFKGRIDPTDITNRIGFILGLDPQSTQFTTVGQAKGVNAFMMRMMLASNKGQEEFDNALLSHDKGWLEKQFATLRAQVEKFKKQKSLTYRDRKAYLLAQKNLQGLGTALTFRAKNERRAQNWMQLVQSIPAPSGGHNLTLAYQAAITTREAAMGNLPGVYAPRSLVSNPIFLARNTLSLLSPKLGLGDLFGSLKASFMAPSLAMGKSFATRGVFAAGIVGATGNLMNRLTKGIAGLAGGLALALYLMFGKAALAGFMIGGAIGFGVGAGVGGFLGLQVALATGPFFPIVALITIPAGFFLGGAAGGFVGGLIGGLIAAGLAANSTTLVSAGTGAAVGAVVGTYAGAVIGGTIGTAIGTGLAALTFGATTPLIPFFTASGTLIGASVGAVVGALAGAAIGYVIGKYILAPVQSFVGNLFAGAAEAGGVLSGFGSLVTGLASTIWGGLAGAVAGAFGFLSGAASFLVGGLGSLSIPTFAIAIPVFGGIGAVATGSILVSAFFLPTIFFNPEKEGELFATGDNQYFKVEKSASPDNIPSNNALPEEIEFTITLTAKETKLTQIAAQDKLTVQGKNFNGDIPVTLPIGTPDCPTLTDLNPGGSWTCKFKTVATIAPNNFADSLVTNIVTISTIPEGQAQATVDEARAFVIIGSPPTDCPRDWPTDHGNITQGPNGPTSHYRSYPGEQAIDIAGNDEGTVTYATFQGTVFDVHLDENNAYGKYVDIEGICDGIYFRARWAHLSGIKVSKGAKVNFHEPVGLIDTTGNAITGTHLHYSFFGLDMAMPRIPQTPSPPDCEPCAISW